MTINSSSHGQPNKQIILVRDTETSDIVHAEEIDKSSLSPQALARMTCEKVVALEGRFADEKYEVIDGSARSVDDFLHQYPEYRPANWQRSPQHG